MKIRRRRPPSSTPTPSESCGFLWPLSTLKDYEVKEINGRLVARMLRRTDILPDAETKREKAYDFRRVIPRTSLGGYEVDEISGRELARVLARSLGPQDARADPVEDPQAEEAHGDDFETPAPRTIYLGDRELKVLSECDLEALLPR